LNAYLPLDFSLLHKSPATSRALDVSITLMLLMLMQLRDIYRVGKSALATEINICYEFATNLTGGIAALYADYMYGDYIVLKGALYIYLILGNI